MPYQGTKTWGAGPWEFPDADKYIRDNCNSLQRVLYSSQIRNPDDAVNPSHVGTTAADFHVQNNLCPSAPDEALTMLVVVTVHAIWLTLGTGPLTMSLKDQSGNIINATGAPLAFNTPSALGAETDITIAGGTLVPAGTNPGYWVRADSGAGGNFLDVFFTSMAWIGLA